MDRFNTALASVTDAVPGRNHRSPCDMTWSLRSAILLLLLFYTGGALGQSLSTQTAPSVTPGLSREAKSRETSSAPSPTPTGHQWGKGPPAIRFVSFKPTYSCGREFQVVEDDHVNLTFRVSGSDASHLLENSIRGPQFFVTKWGRLHPQYKCSGFGKRSNACRSHLQGADGCSCKKISEGVYELTYHHTASKELSSGQVWMQWPGDPLLGTEKFVFPYVKTKDEYNERYCRDVRRFGRSYAERMSITGGAALLTLVVHAWCSALSP